MSIFPESGSFNVDNVRVCKILVRICFGFFVASALIGFVKFGVCVCVFISFAWSVQGCGVTASSMLHGMVFKKEAEGDVTSVKDAKIAVFSCPFDCMVTETKVRYQFLCYYSSWCASVVVDGQFC